MNHVMTISPDGNISTLWTEAIPLEAIGTMTIARASTIEFNNDRQEWEVKFSNSEKVVFRAKSRAECVAWEVETLQAAMMKGSACPI